MPWPLIKTLQAMSTFVECIDEVDLFKASAFLTLVCSNSFDLIPTTIQTPGM